MTKIELINEAYSSGRISGLTANPTPDDITLALGVLERMASQFEEKNICTGYNFEDVPDTNSLTNLELKYQGAYISNLAFWLLLRFGKEPMKALVLEQRKDYAYLSSSTAAVRPIQASRRSPRGSGASRWDQQFYRFNVPTPDPPNSCATNTMSIGDIDNFVEHFDAYLNEGEVIASYTLEADSGLAIVSQSSTDTDVLYQVRADGSGTVSPDSWLQIKIIPTTSTGRKTTRIINFSLTEVVINA